MPFTTKKVPFQDLLQHDSSILRHAVAKLTHIGEQTIPVNTIIFQTYYYYPASLDLFQAFRSPEGAYHNDDLPDILNFSVAPEECRRIIEQANQLRVVLKPMSTQPALSFTVVVDATTGMEGSEMLLSYADGIVFHERIRDALDSTNAIGATVLGIQRTAAYTTL